MGAELNKVELDITKEIINIGLAKSADSLSFFIKEKVLIQLIDLKIYSDNYSPLSKKDNINNSYLLTTKIKGDFSGNAYLVFNELEVEKIIAANLPENVKSNLSERVKMTDAFLLEIDNIITASVITQFSNILQCKIYGDVPALKVLPTSELNIYLNESNLSNLNIIYFNSRFITENLDMNPEFIWLLDDKFFSYVKKLVTDEKKMGLFHKLNASN